MFSNLIESSSHRREYRRRGSFFLFTTASYALLFVIAGVVSIYAYDAKLEDQTLELATIMPLVEAPIPETPEEVRPENPRPSSSGDPHKFIRQNPTASVEDAELTPEHISSVPNLNPPIPRGRPFEIGAINSNPAVPGDPGPRSGTGGGNTTPTPSIAIDEPPPVPKPKPVQKILRKNVINGDAVLLPKPPYPPIAKQTGVHGTVNVQVLIDEKGNVISATVVSGHPLLSHVAKQAALQARFSPTYLGDQPVKVSGVITYNFQLQ